jgi:hypothetical protein
MRVKETGHKLYMANFFPFLDLCDDPYTTAMNCCVTVRQNSEGMPMDLDNSMLQLKWSVIRGLFNK